MFDLSNASSDGVASCQILLETLETESLDICMTGQHLATGRLDRNCFTNGETRVRK